MLTPHTDTVFNNQNTSPTPHPGYLLKYTVLNKKKNHTFTGGKIQQTTPRKDQRVDLLDKDFKMTVLKMFEELKKRHGESKKKN